MLERVQLEVEVLEVVEVVEAPGDPTDHELTTVWLMKFGMHEASLIHIPYVTC